ncbi:MAG: indolepyruvate oxidoreductase subunit beta [Gaiellales bacterium]|nr:indolepyruvate oxidoreductase subunit beta [Gaiellales bacterium]
MKSDTCVDPSGVDKAAPAGTTNIIITGVGGQGVIMASYVLGQAALADGFDVKQSEVHGMSQRGGSVLSHLRFGRKIWSPLVTQGTAHLLLSFEALEALRYVTWLRPGGMLVYNTLQVNPSTVSSGLAEYPTGVHSQIAAAWDRVRGVNATELAVKAGNPKAANMVMLGAAANSLPFSDETWARIIADVVPPKTVEANMLAFGLGRSAE